MEDFEPRRASSSQSPLLGSDRDRPSLEQGDDAIGQFTRSYFGEDSWLLKARDTFRRFLDGKWGHYAVLILVSIDIAFIFADFLISLHVCEHTGDKGFNPEPWNIFNDALGVASLVISCIFMMELILSIWAMGFAGYFNSKFRFFDALVIIAGFIIDVLTHGIVEEAGSIVVIARFSRVFKIVEEFGEAGDTQTSELEQKIEKLEKEVQELRQRNSY